VVNHKNNPPAHEHVALITGGSSGIGLALARLLVKRGWHVWLVARRPDKLADALAELQAARPNGQLCGVIPADVSDPAQASAAAEQVFRQVGVPHLLINSAGAARPGYFQQVELGDFRWMMETNYFGTVYMTRAVLPGMIARNSGHIVNISSLAGFLGLFGYTAYGASKFAVTGFSESLRAEVKPLGIRVSVVFPPDTDTPQLAYENQYKPPETKAITRLAQALPAERVAKAILEQIERGRFLVLPSWDARLLYILGSKFPKNWVFGVLDWLASQGHA
jgi:3-dehydrosphinganine reductase